MKICSALSAVLPLLVWAQTGAVSGAAQAPATMTYGSVTTPTMLQSWEYNTRLQQRVLTASREGVTLLRLTLDYGSIDNNGNVRTQFVENGTKTYQQTYGYNDAANRIRTYSEVTLGLPGEATRTQNFEYDGFGNRWVSSTAPLGLAGGPNVPTGVGAYNLGGVTTNRISGLAYDAAGNLTTLSPYTGEYDAENRLRLIRQTTTGGPIYVSTAYDGNGRRIRRTVGGVTTTYVYDAAGQLMAEYGAQANSVATQFLVADHLGSTRLITDRAANCVQRVDYLPFGSEMPRVEPCYGGDPPSNPSSSSIKFTGKEREAETGLDYFGARYMSAAPGRFISPDPVNHPSLSRDGEEGFLASPQKWNLYSYALNNPLKFIDPDGAEADVYMIPGKGAWSPMTGQYLARQTNADLLRTAAIPVAVMTAAAGGSWFASTWVGRAVLGYFLTPKGQEMAQNAIDAVAPPGGSLRLIPTGDFDRAAVSLAERIGGQASVRIEGVGAREFDAVSKDFVAQTFSSVNAALKPDSFLSKSRREQIRATLEAAQQTGRKAYFEFTGGKPAQEVLDFIKRNAERVGTGYEVQ